MWTIVSDEQKEKWYEILDSTDDINEIKAVLREVIEELRKTWIQCWSIQQDRLIIRTRI